MELEGSQIENVPALFRHTTPHRYRAWLGKVGRGRHPGDSTSVCLGSQQGSHLYQGYPVGYRIAWHNPNVKLKDGTLSAGKRILIDGQQRVIALMAGLLGRAVLTKGYEIVRIRIAFHPLEEKFEVANPCEFWRPKALSGICNEGCSLSLSSVNERVDAAQFGAGCISPLYRPLAHVSPGTGQASKKKAPTNPKDWSKRGQETPALSC
jgi:hypothetical protein